MPICASSPSGHLCTFADIDAALVHGGVAGLGVRRDAAADLGAGAALALLLALWAPLPLAVVTLVLVGPAHTVLELRYVVARFRHVLSGPFLRAACVPVTIIALARLVGPSARAVEIVAAFSLLGLAALWRRQATFLVPLAVALALSLAHPAWYGLVLLHLHNLVPLAFLWEWSQRTAVRAVSAACLVGVPLLIVGGALDPLVLGASPGSGIGPGWATAAAQVTPAGWSTTAAARFFTAFAYLQVVHYVVWCWVFPRHVPEAAVATTGPWRWPAVVAAGTAAVAVVFAVDYTSGRVLYGSLATYHAYLEFPVLLAFLHRSR